VQRYLPFLIEAYLIRQPQQQIYIVAPASSTDMIATLITGLTDSLPRQLLAELTFSTYERDIAKATTQIVGLSWIETPGKEASAGQRFSSHFYREKLAVNCSTDEQSSLIGHRLVINDPSLVTLASSFARYAANCLVADDVKVLYELIEQAEKDPELTIERFLRLYSDEVVNRGNLSQEMIESYLANPLYQIEKLGAHHFRANMLDAVMSNPQWWQSRLRPLLLDLREQSRQEQMVVPQRTPGQNHQVSRQLARKRKASQRAARTSPILLNALARLAKDAIPSIVSAMEEAVTVRDAADEATPRKGMERISTLLDLMSCCLLPEDPIGVWKELLDSVLQKPEACRFLTTRWDIFAWLLREWDIAFAEYPEYDEAVRRVLVVPWPYLGEFLRLRLQEQHSDWHLFAVDSLIGDTSLTPPIAQLLGQNYGEEITELLKHLMQEQRWWVRVAQFVTQLIGNGYPGKPTYYSLIEQLLGYLTQVPQYRLLAKDLVVALTLQRYSGTVSYWRQIEALLRELLKEGQPEEGMDLFHTLASSYDKERFAPIRHGWNP
jgi:hypothetical protein